MKLTGAQIVVETLLDHGVDTVFGYPGGTALNIYDELYKNSERIHHVLTADEQGASYAADGYARATGKTGICMSTSGPGATNLVTGIATACLDSIPVIAITANVPDTLIGKDAFQEIDIVGITMPITKHNFFVTKIEELQETIRRAFQIANSGRKGPVLIDITKDVTAASYEFEHMDPLPLRHHPKIDREKMQEAIKMINSAEKPVLYIGGGVKASEGAVELVRRLAEKADIPVVHTLMAAGVIESDHPLNLGMLGMHGTVAANRAIDQADLVIALGGRFSDRVALDPKRWARRARILQVDIDNSEVDKNVIVDRAVIADVSDFLAETLPQIKEEKHDEWRERVTGWKGKVRKLNEEARVDSPMHPYQIMDTINKYIDEDTIITTDVGQHQMWAAQFLKHYRPERFITSGGLGTMGYGYAAAIGAGLGCPGHRIIHITGDGSFQMNLNEVVTSIDQNVPIITVILNNGTLGMVYQLQETFQGGRHSNTVIHRHVDYAKVAEGFGAEGYRVETPEELSDALRKAVESDVSVWIECVISEEERVLPFIPGGKTVDDMILQY